MDPYCKGCLRHHNAGHPKGSPLYRSKFNDWCMQYGRHASKSVGHCKLNGGRELLPAPPAKETKDE